jgi:hypothetical protein
MFTHSTTKVSTDHVNHIVKSILNKRQRNVIEQQKTFIRRNTDENKKRNNYLVDKFTMKQRTNSSKENLMIPPTKQAAVIKINDDDDDDDDDFISTSKHRKIINQPKINPVVIKVDPIKECLESITLQIENNEAMCPICNQILSSLSTIDQREQHVNRCLEESLINNVCQRQFNRNNTSRLLFSFICIYSIP